MPVLMNLQGLNGYNNFDLMNLGRALEIEASPGKPVVVGYSGGDPLKNKQVRDSHMSMKKGGNIYFQGASAKQEVDMMNKF